MTDDIILQRAGRLGHIILNRPKALNALTRDMANAMGDALHAWATDDSVATVAVSGAGERGLCAGGDIVGIYNDARSGGAGSADFWADEYRVNAFISHYPKPYVAIMDGIVLGGGVGISAHGSVRVVTERTKLGMPEVGIGFTPDVGGSYLLSHAPGELGTHVALTGGTITGADAIALGLADAFVPSDRLAALIESLESTDAEQAVADVAIAPPASDLVAQQQWIDASYAHDDASEIIASLQGSSVEAARDVADVILSKSPTSVVVTLAALRRARALATLEEALDQEYRVSLRLLEAPDIAEGIRAQVIDKDRDPKWNPATLDAVDPAIVEHCFAGLGSRELGLSPTTAP